MFWKDPISATINHSLRSSLSVFLKKHGYKYQGVKKTGTAAIPVWYIAKFSNKVIERIIEINYIPKDHGTYEVFSLCVRELNPEYEDGDYTSLNRMTISGIDIKDLDTNLEAKLVTCINSRLGRLRTDCLPIIKGEFFETEHLDWGNMK